MNVRHVLPFPVIFQMDGRVWRELFVESFCLCSLTTFAICELRAVISGSSGLRDLSSSRRSARIAAFVGKFGRMMGIIL
jgi:hypothetical protein